ncbi:MAG: TIGR03905 family TSCPD domain-containing protein [Clostridia bacterium]|nr:TIGR03905 family TSCPD domain-containing protein [Clostridia bacterium]
MEKHVEYKTSGVCSKALEFDLIDGYVYNVRFKGGCKGNTAGLGALAEGVKAEELVKRLKGIKCQGNNSCPDQLARAIEQNL